STINNNVLTIVMVTTLQSKCSFSPRRYFIVSRNQYGKWDWFPFGPSSWDILSASRESSQPQLKSRRNAAHSAKSTINLPVKDSFQRMDKALKPMTQNCAARMAIYATSVR